MKSFLKKTKDLVFSKQEGIFSSAAILSIMIIVSRIFGFLRYRILAGYFTKEELDIFFASFRIPDLIFEILITGALTSTLIPVFIKFQKNKKQLEENISTIFNLITVALLVFMGVLFFQMENIIPMITPGFSPEKTELVILYSQVLLLGQIPFMIVGNFVTGIAQANKTFFITAIAPVAYNLAIIFSTLLFVDRFHLFAPIIGVVAGAILFFLIQLPIIFRLNFHFLPVIHITSGVKDFFIMVVPRLLTVLVNQIDATIDLTLTTLLGAGSYTVFYLAQHLQLLPVSIFGIAYGQASLPYLSELYQERKIDEFKKLVTDTILNLFFFTLPIMGFFIIARTPIVRLFFGGAKFDWDATVLTAVTLSFFALSMPFHSIYYFLVRCFYAILDTKTPFIIGAIAILINALLSIYFVRVLHMPVWSLAVSFSISVTINVSLLLFVLAKRLKGLYFRMLAIQSTKIFVCVFLSSFVSYYYIKLTDGLIFDTTRTLNVFLILATSGILYLLLYLFLSWFFAVKQLHIFSGLLLKTKKAQKKIVEVYSSYE